MTLAEEFERAAKELRTGLEYQATTYVAWAKRYADLLDRAAELARDQERVVQSIVARDVP